MRPLAPPIGWKKSNNSWNNKYIVYTARFGKGGNWRSVELATVFIKGVQNVVCSLISVTSQIWYQSYYYKVFMLILCRGLHIEYQFHWSSKCNTSTIMLSRTGVYEWNTLPMFAAVVFIATNTPHLPRLRLRCKNNPQKSVCLTYYRYK